MFKPTIGPIVGHATTNEVRIFMRGEQQDKKRVFAGVRARKAGTEKWSNSVFALLNPANDMSGVLVLQDLEADCEYEYQAGWLSPMNPVHTIDTVIEFPLQWPRQLYRFRTRTAKASQPGGLSSVRAVIYGLPLASLPCRNWATASLARSIDWSRTVIYPSAR